MSAPYPRRCRQRSALVTWCCLARLWSPLSDASRSPIDIASFEQEALASIIKTGAYESHVRKMRRLNAERRAVFLNALAEAFGDEVDIVGTSAGLHVVVSFNHLTGSDEARFAACARQEGVGIYPISRLYAAPTDRRAGFIFGYASMPVEQIGKGVNDLVQVYRSKFRSA